MRQVYCTSRHQTGADTHKSGREAQAPDIAGSWFVAKEPCRRPEQQGGTQIKNAGCAPARSSNQVEVQDWCRRRTGVCAKWIGAERASA